VNPSANGEMQGFAEIPAIFFIVKEPLRVLEFCKIMISVIFRKRFPDMEKEKIS